MNGLLYIVRLSSLKSITTCPSTSQQESPSLREQHVGRGSLLLCWLRASALSLWNLSLCLGLLLMHWLQRRPWRGCTTEPLCADWRKWASQEWVHEIVMHVCLRQRDTAGCHSLKPQRMRAYVLNVRVAHKGRAAVPLDTETAFCHIQVTDIQLLRAEISSSHRQMQQ